MKKIIYSILICLLITACSSNKYEKAIANFIQTDKKGAKYDMKFKALEIKELKNITVADSIEILNKKTQDDWDYATSRYESLLKMSNSAGVKDDLGCQQKIDSLKALKPDNSDKYPNRKSDEVLAIAVECKYTLVPPMVNTSVEDTHVFIFTPDGDTCYRKMKKLE